MNETQNPTEIKVLECQGNAASGDRRGEAAFAWKALDVSFADPNGKPVYNVKTFQNNAVWKV